MVTFDGFSTTVITKRVTFDGFSTTIITKRATFDGFGTTIITKRFLPNSYPTEVGIIHRKHSTEWQCRRGPSLLD